MSGVVFAAKQAGARRVVGGRPLYFCCTSCADYFDAHRPAVAAARKLE